MVRRKRLSHYRIIRSRRHIADELLSVEWAAVQTVFKDDLLRWVTLAINASKQIVNSCFMVLGPVHRFFSGMVSDFLLVPHH